MEFYKNVGKTLLIFNVISIFFLFLTIFGYSLIQYMFQPAVGITNLLFPSDPVAVQNAINVLELAMVIPQMFDYAFLLLIMVLIFDLFLLAWRTKTGSIFSTIAFSLIGLPVWVFIMEYVTQLKTWALNYLGSAIIYNQDLTFYSYVQNNSLELSIIIFMIAIGIRSIDWGNIKLFDRNGNKEGSSTSEKGFEDLIKQ